MRAGRNRFSPLDAELFLKAEGSAAVAADETTSYFDLGVSTAEWHEGIVGAKQQFVIVLNVTALDTSTDEAYTASVHAANADESVEVDLNTVTIDAVGEYIIPVVREQLDAAGASKVAVSVTAGGTTPSITYNARIAPYQGQL